MPKPKASGGKSQPRCEPEPSPVRWVGWGERRGKVKKVKTRAKDRREGVCPQSKV